MRGEVPVEKVRVETRADNRLIPSQFAGRTTSAAASIFDRIFRKREIRANIQGHRTEKQR